MPEPSVADIEGPWSNPSGEESGLIERCREHWTVPADELPDVMVATFLNQGIAVSLMIAEARRRIAQNRIDESELYEGQLVEALNRATL
jgi:hypothetical protein